MPTADTMKRTHVVLRGKLSLRMLMLIAFLERTAENTTPSL